MSNMPSQITAQADPASSFEIKIDFEKHSDRPGRVFQSMAQMIESFQVIDNDFLFPFDVRAETFLILEDIKAGSLRTRLYRRNKQTFCHRKIYELSLFRRQSQVAARPEDFS
jgi:hypothetical protein